MSVSCTCDAFRINEHAHYMSSGMHERTVKILKMLQWAISRKPNLTYFTISYRVGSSETTREARIKNMKMI